MNKVIDMETIKGAKLVKDLLEEMKNDDDWEELLNETDEEREAWCKAYEEEQAKLEKRYKEIEEKNKNKTDEEIEKEMKDYFEKGIKWWE